jgi:hypothetical protein
MGITLILADLDLYQIREGLGIEEQSVTELANR